jgi:hypothetical protein
MSLATGTFEAKLTPEAAGTEPSLGRMALAKQFRGDLEAVSSGQMLTGGTSVKGSAGYVAMERVSGALHGHAGEFTLQHSGTMNRGEPRLSITVVPDSGAGELTGLTGSMQIMMAAGGHSYEFEYTLPEAADTAV